MAKTPERQAQHPEKIKSELIARLNRIEGQIRGAARMIEENAYCDEIINLFSSIQAALSGTAILLLEQHVKKCVLNRIKDGDVEVIDELLKTVRRMAR